MKNAVAVLFLSVFLLILPSLSYAAVTDLLTGDMLTDALNLVTNPSELFLEFHTDMEDMSPVIPKKYVNFQTSLLFNTIPFTFGNVNLKGVILPEFQPWPKVTVGVTYWNLVALKLAQKYAQDVVKTADSSGYSYFMTVSKSFNTSQLYAGAKNTSLGFNLSLDPSINESSDTTSGDTGGASFSIPTDIQSSFKSPSVYVGFSFESKPGRFVNAEIGYYYKIKKIVSRIQWNYRFFVLGVAYYPESVIGSVLPIRPYLKFNLSF